MSDGRDFPPADGSETGETGVGGVTTGGGAGAESPPPQGEPPATDGGESDYGYESTPPGPHTDEDLPEAS